MRGRNSRFCHDFLSGLWYIENSKCERKNAVISIDRFEEILGELAEELPAEFYTGLNGGILIEDRHPLHPADRNGDLYIMGEYRNDPSTGRCIVLYYGSFRRVFRHLDEDELRTEMRKVLRHEFRHHVEGRAGVRDLEEWDAEQIRAYRARKDAE